MSRALKLALCNYEFIFFFGVAISCIQRLDDLGARKIVIPNVGPIGCIPYQRDINPSEGNDCVALANHLAQLYNRQLKSLLEELNIELKGSTFLFADVYNIVADIIQNFESYGE